LNRRKLSGLLLLSLLPFLSSCIPEPGTQVSWSPSGRRVGFLSLGRPFVYDLESAKLFKVSTQLGTASQLAWSGEENLLAVSSGSVVELVAEDRGVYASSGAFAAPGFERVEDAVLSWHPSKRRLLLVRSFGKTIDTTEFDATSGAVDAAPGIGTYGPGGKWLLWINGGAVGHHDRMIAAREGPDHATLPLSDEDQATLGDEAVEMLSIWGNPPCFSQKHDETAKILCFDAEGRLRPKAEFAKGEDIGYINRTETLFAVVGSTPTIFDVRGRVKARGVKLAQALGQRASADASNAAWSPDGNWISFVVGGRLYLWNWRNDVASVVSPAE
jgi:hypothetical protein